MKQLTEKHTFRLSLTQKDTLRKLKLYKVDVSRFIRDAIREKLERDHAHIKEYRTKVKVPF